jgi:hypothetical protein
MDVLEYWRPNIDWSGFKQGPVSAQMWQHFQNLVQLCHAYRYWQSAAQENRRQPIQRSLYGNESAHMRRKHRQEWQGAIDRCEDHMYRAAYLAAEQMSAMSFLISDSDTGKPDWVFWMALRLALADQPRHERARCNAGAFDSFDAELELQEAPDRMALRWLERGGYRT